MLKIALESLGCSKNLVDAEIMMGILNNKGYKLIGDFEEADVIIVNTCGFIESAKQESIDTIINFAELKKTGNLKLLIVTGCLAQRYSEELNFKQLVDFVEEVKFDRLGAFAYSREEDTPADRLPNHIDEEVKIQRRDTLMMIQQKISEELNDKKIGKTYEVLIEEQIEDNVYTGRTQGDAEEIDSIVYVKSVDNLEVGEFVSVQINDAMEYDLMGDVLYELA
ncbi:TPA: TRAM domain-containing protein [Clostridioides difficile]|uniref:Ribosomal protein S12 methylthiotransferase RimO n=1 Tax=Clostridioides difficile TaxID=1496 RepID=A0A9X8RFW2_CLODI|nr:TRAM domain-containing protein [Clostridioides difficile]EGT4930982.1 TRAM domain-containing protein [Clostridioides difficile]EQH21032.1 hypothetical protein QKW_1377 [Clostridioides difficile DA00210]EQK08210.1 hypothetical protein QUM_1316 [Clostridioides difficile P78]MCO4404530.1 TRAM domain-containing protein [Clostridioides difficile]MDK3326233.1 TRAM domain-containing protein [Clostridioides difficile]